MDIELIWVMMIRDDNDGVRTARAFATRKGAIAAIRAMLLAAEKESDPAAIGEREKTLETVNGDLSLQTDWDGNAVIDLIQVGVESVIQADDLVRPVNCSHRLIAASVFHEGRLPMPASTPP